ncbi:MAG TPA: GNAT family N-acetyltransferase [Verrucomicrobiae bacterium]|nr:GNAT family N-acetyltransferase [Verrucomicrobiae bacterium]
MKKLLAAPCDQAAAKPEGNRVDSAHRILVVEDDCQLRQLNSQVLSHHGYAVDAAENGATAWEALQINRYDLLITDNNMPRLTGIELLKKLRSARMGLPVIMATGTLPRQELAQNPWLEPVATLVKPYAPDQLLVMVKEVLHTVFSKNGHLPVAPKPNDAGAFSVERYTASRKREWDAFVSAAKNATFLFSRDYMDYHRDRFADHSLMIFNDHVLVAVLPANLNANGTLISHEGLTYGGLVVSRAATLGEVLACFHVVLHSLSQKQIPKLLYKRIPGFYSTLPDDEVAYALFLLDARLYRRDSSTAVPQTDRLPVRKHHQRLIKKAINSGVRILQETSFRTFWERVLTPQLAARYGAKPVHTLEEITLLASRFPEQIKQFSAYCGDEIVAGTTIYETPTVAHLQYGAVTETGRRTGAQAYLFSWLIEQYKDKRFFDFGTSNENEGRALNHGLLEWKEGFGARCFAHDFYEIATGNYPKLEPVLQVRPEINSPPPGTGQAWPAASGDRPVRAYFAHSKALIDEGVSIGQGTRVWAFAHVVGGAILGEDCNICDHTFIEGGVRIGNRVTVKCGVFLWDGLTVEDDVFIGPGAIFTNDSRPRSKKYLARTVPTVLQEGCTLGAGSTTLPGITIGRWAMVGAGAIVTHDVPNHALVVGSPARWRAWICRCGEKLFPTSGRLLGCACGRAYEQITENEVREFAANTNRQSLPADRAATDSRETILKSNGHPATNNLSLHERS